MSYEITEQLRELRYDFLQRVMRLLECHPEHKASIVLETRRCIEELSQNVDRLGNDFADVDDYPERRRLLFTTYLTSDLADLTNDDLTLFTTATTSHSNDTRTAVDEAESHTRALPRLYPDAAESSDDRGFSSGYGPCDLSLLNRPPLFSLSETASDTTDLFINPAELHRQPSSDRHVLNGHPSDDRGSESDCGSADIVARLRRSRNRHSEADMHHRTERLRGCTGEGDLTRIQMTVSSRRDNLSHEAVMKTRTLDISSQIEHQLGATLEQKHRKYVPFLRRLFFAIGSPEVIVQLRAVVAIVRKQERFQIPSASDGIAGVVNALDMLEVAPFNASLVRRFCLQRLFEQRAKLRSAIEARRSNLTISTQEEGTSGDIRCQVITEMLKLAYPLAARASLGCATHKKTAKQRRKSLFNRLSSATNWHMLSSKFHVGILALLPHIPSQDLEYIPVEPFTRFLEMLECRRGSSLKLAAERLSLHIEAVLEGRDRQTRFKFEDVDQDDLSTGRSDSEALLEWCSPATESAEMHSNDMTVN